MKQTNSFTQDQIFEHQRDAENAPVKCADCTEYVPESMTITVDGKQFCESCADHLPQCDGCSEVHTPEALTPRDGYKFCATCIAQVEE